MSRRGDFILCGLFALLFALVLALAHRGRGAAKEGDDIRVGAYLSLSGDDASFGADTQKGIDLATEQVNASAGRVKGKKIRVYYEDDQSKPNDAREKVQQLIDREQVVALLGEVASSRTQVGGIIAEQKKIPMITPSSTAVEVTEGMQYTFRTCFTDAQQGEVAARFAYETLGKRTAAIFFAAQDPYSAGLAQRFTDNFVELGGTIVLSKGFQKKETNFATYLEALKAAKPDMIFVPVYYNEMVPIAQQARTIGIPGSMFIGGDGWDSEELLEAKEELDGAYFTNHYAPDVPWENSKAFIAEYRRRWGNVPTSLAAQGYDSALLLYDAMNRATDLTPEAIKNAIAETKNFQGATGLLTIDKDHNANKPIVIVQVTPSGLKYAAERFAEGGAKHASTSAKEGGVQLGQALLSGLAQGAMIALVALGYTLVFGVLKMINFAHSEVFMMAAYVGYFVIVAVGGKANPFVAGVAGVVVAMIAASMLGVVIERVAYRPLRKRGGKSKLARISPLVTAIGVSVLLQNVAQLVFTARPKNYPRLVEEWRYLVFGVALAVMVMLEVIVKFTWFGKGMRALSANDEAARLMGVRTSRSIAYTFVLGSALAAIGAVLFAVSQSPVSPTMGVKIGTQAFVAAVIGGIGSISGAMLGGLLLGVVGELVKLTSYSGGVDVLVFVVLILVLMVRPAGLLGSTRAEKV